MNYQRFRANQYAKVVTCTLSAEEYAQLPKECFELTELEPVGMSMRILLEELLAAYIAREFSFNVMLDELHRHYSVLAKQREEKWQAA
jgi:hypothetical protein